MPEILNTQFDVACIEGYRSADFIEVPFARPYRVIPHVVAKAGRVVKPVYAEQQAGEAFAGNTNGCSKLDVLAAKIIGLVNLMKKTEGRFCDPDGSNGRALLPGQTA